MAAAGKISEREGWENAFCGVEPLTLTQDLHTDCRQSLETLPIVV